MWARLWVFVLLVMPMIGRAGEVGDLRQPIGSRRRSGLCSPTIAGNVMVRRSIRAG